MRFGVHMTVLTRVNEHMPEMDGGRDRERLKTEESETMLCCIGFSPWSDDFIAFGLIARHRTMVEVYRGTI